MTFSGMVYATNAEQCLVAVTDERGFTVLALDSGPAEIGDTLTSDVDGMSWFNKSRGVRLVAYPKKRGVRSSELRQHLFPISGSDG